MARCTVYEDLPEEVLAFMSQKLKRDSFKMPQAELETLVRVSLQTTKQGAGVVSVEPDQSGTRAVSRETERPGTTESGSLENEPGAGVSRETEQPKARNSLQTDQPGVAASAANKPKYKISTSQVFFQRHPPADLPRLWLNIFSGLWNSRLPLTV